MDESASDEDLMLAYRTGDASAFDVLYARHRGPVYRYLLRQCSNRALADEMFQDVWLNLIRARQRYTVGAKFTTYLYRIAHNRLVDHHRHSARRLEQTGSSQDVVEGYSSELDEPGRQLDSERALSKLNDLIRALPTAQRETFLLYEEAGLSVGEIAALMDVGQDTAKSRLRYAMAKLRRGLMEDR